MAGVNHTGNNHGAGSRTNSLEPPMDSDFKNEQHREFRLGEDGLFPPTETKRRHSFRYYFKLDFSIIIELWFGERLLRSKLIIVIYL